MTENKQFKLIFETIIEAKNISEAVEKGTKLSKEYNIVLNGVIKEE